MATPVAERKQPADRAVARRPEHEFDAILVVSFGGPEGMDDVLPFLENVTRGRGVPRERLLEVAHHYERFGGVSPINEQNRALIAALEPELHGRGIELPVAMIARVTTSIRGPGMMPCATASRRPTSEYPAPSVPRSRIVVKPAISVLRK